MNVSSALAPASLLTLIAACGDPISNDVFLDDLQYVEALPSADRHRIALGPEAAETPSESPEPGSTVWLLQLTDSVANGINTTTDDLLGVVDFVRTIPPNERYDNARVWGPMEIEHGRWLRMESKRIGVGEFDWAFTWAASEDGQWTEFFVGEHFAGTTVQDGDGWFRFDWAEFSVLEGGDRDGLMDVDYDNRDGKELLVALKDFRDGDNPVIDADYWYDSDGEQTDFEFVTDSDLLGEDITDWSIRTRQRVTGEGRSDARVYSVSLGAEILLTQCWDPAGGLVFQWDDGGFVEAFGTESDCAFSERAEVAHLGEDG